MNDKNKVVMIRLNAPILDGTDHPHQFYPPFLLKYLESLLKQDGTFLIKFRDGYVNDLPKELLLNETADWPANVVVMFLTSLNSNNSINFINELKQRAPNILTIGVGPDITLNQTFYEGTKFDFIMAGEAEEQTYLLIKNINENNIGSINNPKGKSYLIDDLDRLPFPQYSAAELASYNFFYPVPGAVKRIWGHLLASRGCSHTCFFCSQNTRETYSKTVRLRSAKKVVDEIECLMRSGANFISFADDDFSISRALVESICGEIIARDLKFRWTAQLRVDEVDLQLLTLMRESGCALLAFGVETGSPKMIEIYKKNEKSIDWINAAKVVFADCKSLKIATIGLFIIGGPSEKEGDIKLSIKLARELDPDLIQVHFFTLYPGSEAFKLFKERIPEDQSNLYHYASPLLNLSDISTVKLSAMQTAFYRDFLLRPEFIVKHALRYTSFYLKNFYIFSELIKKISAFLFSSGKSCKR